MSTGCNARADCANYTAASRTLNQHALREQGVTNEDAWDIDAIRAAFGLSNRIANLTTEWPNGALFLMEGVPQLQEAPSPTAI